MIRLLTRGIAALAACAAASIASAGVYTDYTPEKGIWDVMAVEVDPNHLDDYLAGLRRTQLPAAEIMRKRGMIDAYRVRVRHGFVKGQPNVMLETHFTSVAVIAPDKTRDLAIEKEIYASLPKTEADKVVAEYEKYRTFLDNAYWTEVTLAK